MTLPGFRGIDLAVRVLRPVLGVLLILHGLLRIKDMRKPAVLITSTSWGWASGFAYLFTLLEVFGGFALILGFLTQPVALLFVLEMIATTILHRVRLQTKPMGG